MDNNVQAEPRKMESLPEYTPEVDLIDRGDHFELRADMPGVRSEDLGVDVEDYVLHLSGVARSEHPTGFQAAKREFENCEYKISYRLSHEIDIENIEANLNNGMLSVTLPKREEIKPRKIKVEVV